MFRFSIRDVLWLTALVAMGVGWCVERSERTVSTIALDDGVVAKLKPGREIVVKITADDGGSVRITLAKDNLP
jgi:invasion protein IalB